MVYAYHKKNKWDVLDYQNYELPVFSIWLEKDTLQLTVSGAFNSWDSSDLVEIEFIQFFDALMVGAVQYSLNPNSSRFMQLAMNTVQCSKCKQTTNLIMDINYFIHYVDQLTKIYRLNIEQLSQSHLNILNDPKILDQYNYGYIIKRFSKTRGEAYLSNGCYHCDAIQGTFFKRNELNEEHMTYSKFFEVKIEHETKIDGHWFYLK